MPTMKQGTVEETSKTEGGDGQDEEEIEKNGAPHSRLRERF